MVAESYQRDAHESMHVITFHHLPGGDSDIGVYAELCTLTQPMAAHYHDFWELAFAVKGSGHHEDEQARLPLLSGDVWIIRPGQWHAFPLVRESLSIFNLLFTREFAERHAQALQYVQCLTPLACPTQNTVVGHAVSMPVLTPSSIRSIRLSLQGLNHIYSLLITLVSELHTPQAMGHTCTCTGLVLQILGLLDRYNPGEAAGSTQELAMRHDLGILNAVQYIEEQYAQALTLEEIALHSCYTPAYLGRKFRQLLGVSPIDYLLQVRLHHACTLLKTTDASVMAVAHQVGFTDSRYFATRFRYALGMTPTQFRERIEQQG